MKRNNIYLATKLFSFYDRYASTNMYEAILKSEKYKNANIYLPFRDSNMKVSNIGNVSKNIFEADIYSLKKTDIFICRTDGLSFDAGIGFELGYCLGRGCLLYVFSTDFIRSKINEQKFTITNVVDKMSNSFYYEYVNDTKLNYEENIEENINIFKKFVSDKIEENTFKYKEKIEKNKKFDVFIDICGQRYEWNKMVAYKLLNELEKNNITYWISDRYRKDYEFDKDISALNNSKIYLTCLDENEPNFDSCILQGYAYNKEKYIIGYESNNVTYYVDGGQEMGVNLMVEQSCDILLNSYKKVINKILEIKNEEKN